MIVSVIILSSVFIGIAFLVNKDNAKYLLSGYNTMTDEERNNFEIQLYIPFFKKFHLFLGISVLIVASLLYYFVDTDASGIFMAIYPLLAYTFFLWKSNKFYILKTKKQIVISYAAMTIMFFLVVVIAYEFKNSLTNNEILLKENHLEISGEYGSKIDIISINSIVLIDSLPQITSKLDGFDLKNIRKGYFKTKNGEKVKLLINTKSAPYILITIKDSSKIYYNSKNASSKYLHKKLNSHVFND